MRTSAWAWALRGFCCRFTVSPTPNPPAAALANKAVDAVIPGQPYAFMSVHDGTAVALLAGDALLVQGSSLLRKECQSLKQEQKELIPHLVSEALMRISKAEAKENHLKRRLDVTPEEYLKVIKLRAVVPEVHCRIGGILADATPRMIEFLAHYGRTFGVVSTVGGEFLDLMEYQEFQNRLKNECPTLPMLCALQNVKDNAKLKLILGDKNLTRSKADTIVKTVMSSEEVGALKRDTLSIINEEIVKVATILRSPEGKEATLLLQAAASLLQN